MKLLRVAAAVRAGEGRDAMGDLYTRFGGDIHVRRRRKELTDHWQAGSPTTCARSASTSGTSPRPNDPTWDEVLQAETDEALSRTGRDVGTPIITFHRDGASHSFFGPVINAVPRGGEALRLWDAVWEVATFPGMAEIKRSMRGEPQLADSLPAAS